MKGATGLEASRFVNLNQKQAQEQLTPWNTLNVYVKIFIMCLATSWEIVNKYSTKTSMMFSILYITFEALDVFQI